MIRQVMQRDADRVAELLRRLWPGKRIEPENVGEIVERYGEDPDYWIYSYEEDGVLLGIITVSFRWTLFHQGEVAIVEDLVIGEAYRDRGIGSSLAKFVEDEIISDSRAKAVEVNSDLHRASAHRFWQRCGYSELAFQFRKEM